MDIDVVFYLYDSTFCVLYAIPGRVWHFGQNFLVWIKSHLRKVIVLT